MKIPVMRGVIDRRMLVNFTADPIVVQKLLPQPFQPLLFADKSIVGICLIRLKHIRPKGFPSFLGISSENGAHRIAVQWKENNEMKQGVYIPRRDSSSWMNTLAGGRVFPGKHFHAHFNVKETGVQYHIDFKSSDGTLISVDAALSDRIQSNSIFPDMTSVSQFFEKGSVGYSPNGSKHEGMRLKTFNWKVQPLNVTNVRSSFFDNEDLFPKGSVRFDNALLMTQIEHEWESVQKMSSGAKLIIHS
jgi:hypothetical protein